MSDISDFVKRMTSCSKLELDGKIPVEPPFSYCMVYIDNFTSLEPFDPSKVTKDHVVVSFKNNEIKMFEYKELQQHTQGKPSTETSFGYKSIAGQRLQCIASVNKLRSYFYLNEQYDNDQYNFMIVGSDNGYITEIPLDEVLSRIDQSTSSYSYNSSFDTASLKLPY